MENLKIFYKKYSAIILPGLFILGIFIIVIQVLLPSLSITGDTRQQLNNEEKKLADYKTSIDTLKEINESKLTQNVKVANLALPSTKDVESIYNVLDTNAKSSGIILTGFSVAVGDVYGKTKTTVDSASMPYLLVKVQLSNVDARSLLEFSNLLLNSSPLSEIVSANISGGDGDLDVIFYYKPYDLNQINRDVVKPLTTSQVKLLQSLPQIP